MHLTGNNFVMMSKSEAVQGNLSCLIVGRSLRNDDGDRIDPEQMNNLITPCIEANNLS